MFPTVTICEEGNNVDRWGMVVKLLDYLQMACQVDFVSYSNFNCSDSQKLRTDFNTFFTESTKAMRNIIKTVNEKKSTEELYHTAFEQDYYYYDVMDTDFVQTIVDIELANISRAEEVMQTCWDWITPYPGWYVYSYDAVIDCVGKYQLENPTVFEIQTDCMEDTLCQAALRKAMLYVFEAKNIFYTTSHTFGQFLAYYSSKIGYTTFYDEYWPVDLDKHVQK